MKILLPDDDTHDNTKNAAKTQEESLLYKSEFSNHDNDITEDNEITDEKHSSILESLRLQGLKEHFSHKSKGGNISSLFCSISDDLNHPRLKLGSKLIQSFSSLYRAKLFEDMKIDLGNPSDGGDRCSNDVATAVVADITQEIMEVLLNVEDTALVPAVDGVHHVLVGQVGDDVLVVSSIFAPQLEDALLHADCSCRLDKVAIGLRIEGTTHILS